jgi:hypothetical protein
MHFAWSKHVRDGSIILRKRGEESSFVIIIALGELMIKFICKYPRSHSQSLEGQEHVKTGYSSERAVKPVNGGT